MNNAPVPSAMYRKSGFQFVDLDFLTIGLVIDMWTERVNDSVKYKRLASQEDFDKF